tara:strand:+ start:7841 stop:8245 length:405 start_codon:yes stop_codon:yes gene_type:complete
MKNTLENKQRFLGHYLGQEVFNIDNETDIKLTPLCIQWTNDIRNGYLKLTSLENITDEDAIEIAAIHYHNLSKELLKPDVIQLVKTMLLAHKDCEEILICEISDYLRSKGYALPYLGLSVEQLIHFGWIQIREI